MNPIVKAAAHQDCWILRNKQVELAVTRLGGHMAPVTFHRDTSEPVQPYYISPWQGEKAKIDVPVLKPLRGNFFCMPFGGDNAYRGEVHPAHGETATAQWRLGSVEKSGPVTQLTLTMETRCRPGTVTKRHTLVDGHNVVYTQHVLEGLKGRMPLGHHATLALPDEPGALKVATSRIRFGMTNPALFSDPAAAEYQCLAIGKRFKDITRVPLDSADHRHADCSAFPARSGYTDLVAVFAKPPAGQPAWTTATVDRQGYLWFSIRDPAVLPATVFWISNQGRHGAPWNGRNRCLGLEDVCAYFADGLANSVRRNLLSEDGVPTSILLSPKHPTTVNYIEGVAKVQRGFDRVHTAEFAPGQVTFVSTTGKRCSVQVAHEYAFTGTCDALASPD